jgi:hypothetical protein
MKRWKWVVLAVSSGVFVPLSGCALTAAEFFISTFGSTIIRALVQAITGGLTGDPNAA